MDGKVHITNYNNNNVSNENIGFTPRLIWEQ